MYVQIKTTFTKSKINVCMSSVFINAITMSLKELCSQYMAKVVSRQQMTQLPVELHCGILKYIKQTRLEFFDGVCDRNNRPWSPYIVRQWHPDNGPIENYTKYSDTKVKWMCDREHVWWDRICSRVFTLKKSCAQCMIENGISLIDHVDVYIGDIPISHWDAPPFVEDDFL